MIDQLKMSLRAAIVDCDMQIADIQIKITAYRNALSAMGENTVEVAKPVDVVKTKSIGDTGSDTVFYKIRKNNNSIGIKFTNGYSYNIKPNTFHNYWVVIEYVGSIFGGVSKERIGSFQSANKALKYTINLHNALEVK